jgi:hypothetical protein
MVETVGSLDSIKDLNVKAAAAKAPAVAKVDKLGRSYAPAAARPQPPAFG